MKCSAVFKTNPTDQGMCCTFDALAAEKLYKESKFTKSASHLQKLDIQDSFDAPGDLPDWFKTNLEPFPDRG